VYHVGRAVRLLDVARGRSTQLAVAAAIPFDLSIEGRRVVWAENVAGRGTVRR
jgi:hypothetical protein